MFYAAMTNGDIRTYDAATGSLLNTVHVGSVLAGMDISPDGKFLLVAEDVKNPYPGKINGVIHKVDLATGAITNFSMPFFGLEGPFHDIAMFENGMALATTRFRGSGNSTTYALDTTAGTFTYLTNQSSQAAIALSSADRRHAVVGAGFNVQLSGAIFGIAGDGSIQLEKDTGGLRPIAVTADGSLFATKQIVYDAS